MVEGTKKLLLTKLVWTYNPDEYCAASKNRFNERKSKIDKYKLIICIDSVVC